MRYYATPVQYSFILARIVTVSPLGFVFTAMEDSGRHCRTVIHQSVSLLLGLLTHVVMLVSILHQSRVIPPAIASIIPVLFKADLTTCPRRMLVYVLFSLTL